MFHLKTVSPLTLAWTGAAGLALDLAIATLLLGVAVARWAPPQDLPWTPLRLNEPVGFATRAKFEAAVADPARCRAVLAEGGVAFVEEPARTAGACATDNTVRLGAGVAPLSPARPVMTCPLALAYAFWVRHDVQPAARAELGQPIARIEHYGTFACRNLYGRTTGARSQHATANALDVAAFRTASGTQVGVLRHFPGGDAEGRFLRTVRDGACRWFRATLSPDYNAAHADHLHLDRGRFAACR
ncbi:extensin family protein [Phenylobacterium sp.]|uniref:extensin-like domain-containing protein n=1 Tax=Phenylobacterium sp. TaxID=1871053 RepID=UPI00301E25EB